MDFKEITRRFKDRVRSYDDDTDEHPKKILAQCNREIAGINPYGRLEAVKFAKSYAEAYYVGRHGDPIPLGVKNNLRDLEEKVNKMNSVEASREYIRQAGSPEKFLAGLVAQSRQQQAAANASMLPPLDKTVRLNVSQENKQAAAKGIGR